MHPSSIVSVEIIIGSSSVNVTLISGQVLSVPDDPLNRHTQAVEEWFALGNAPTVIDPPPEDTLEDTLGNLPEVWKAVFDAYIEQQPRNKRAIINNIKRHLK